MNEASVVAKIKQEFKKQLPRAVVLKLQDYMTTGIPDLIVSYAKRATWTEVKLLKPHETDSSFRKHFDQMQLATAFLLENQVSTWYLIAYHGLPYCDKKANMRAVLIRPSRLRHVLEHNYDIGYLAGQAHHDSELPDIIDTLVHLVKFEGGILL